MWKKPAFTDLRIGFEVTMYFASRWTRLFRPRSILRWPGPFAVWAGSLKGRIAFSNKYTRLAFIF